MEIVKFNYKKGTYQRLKVTRTAKHKWVTKEGDFDKNSDVYDSRDKECKLIMKAMRDFHQLNAFLRRLGVPEKNIWMKDSVSWKNNANLIEKLTISANCLVYDLHLI